MRMSCSPRAAALGKCNLGPDILEEAYADMFMALKRGADAQVKVI